MESLCVLVVWSLVSREIFEGTPQVWPVYLDEFMVGYGQEKPSLGRQGWLTISMVEGNIHIDEIIGELKYLRGHFV